MFCTLYVIQHDLFITSFVLFLLMHRHVEDADLCFSHLEIPDPITLSFKV